MKTDPKIRPISDRINDERMELFGEIVAACKTRLDLETGDPQLFVSDLAEMVAKDQPGRYTVQKLFREEVVHMLIAYQALETAQDAAESYEMLQEKADV